MGPGEPGRGDAAARSGRCAGGHDAPVPGVGGRRRVQRGARPAPLLRDEDGGGDRAGGQRRGTADRRPDAAGRRGPDACEVGEVRRRGTDDAQWAELYRARIWRTRGTGLQRPRPHGGEPVAAGRDRLGRDIRHRGRALAAHWRNLLRAERIDRGGRKRSDDCGAQARGHRQLRPELPRLAVEVDWRQSAGDRGEPRVGAVRGCDAGQRRGLYRRAGIRDRGRGRETLASWIRAASGG